MEQLLRRAVLDKLEGLGERAGYAEADQLVSLARTEIRRLTDGWRKLLVIHQPDDDGRCPQCAGWFRRRRWPCSVWLAAHQHLIGEGLTHRNRRQPLCNPFARRERTVVVPRQLPPAAEPERDTENTEPLARIDAQQGRVWRIPRQQPTPQFATPVHGRLETSSDRIHRASVVERSTNLPGPRVRAKVRTY